MKLCTGCGNPAGVLICSRCLKSLHKGYAILVEVSDNSKPTDRQVSCSRYIVVINASAYKNMEPGVYAVRRTDLRQFMGSLYKTTINASNRPEGKTIIESRTTGSEGRVAELLPQQRIPIPFGIAERVRRDREDIHQRVVHRGVTDS